jgi:hypothetical protein
MKDFTLYYLFKMQPNALLIRQNFIVVKSGCYKPTPLKGISPTRYRKRLGINQGNLLWALLCAPTLPHLPCGDSSILCTSWLPYYESLVLRCPRSWLAFRYRLNLLQGQGILWVVAPLALISTSSAVTRETHHALLTTVVVTQVDKPVLVIPQF